MKQLKTNLLTSITLVLLMVISGSACAQGAVDKEERRMLRKDVKVAEHLKVDGKTKAFSKALTKKATTQATKKQQTFEVPTFELPFKKGKVKLGAKKRIAKDRLIVQEPLRRERPQIEKVQKLSAEDMSKMKKNRTSKK